MKNIEQLCSEVTFLTIDWQFHVLRDMDDVTSETMLLLWSMKEKNNPHSKYRTYFNSLPPTFNTGGLAVYYGYFNISYHMDCIV